MSHDPVFYDGDDLFFDIDHFIFVASIRKINFDTNTSFSVSDQLVGDPFVISFAAERGETSSYNSTLSLYILSHLQEIFSSALDAYDSDVAAQRVVTLIYDAVSTSTGDLLGQYWISSKVLAESFVSQFVEEFTLALPSVGSEKMAEAADAALKDVLTSAGQSSLSDAIAMFENEWFTPLEAIVLGSAAPDLWSTLLLGKGGFFSSSVSKNFFLDLPVANISGVTEDLTIDMENGSISFVVSSVVVWIYDCFEFRLGEGNDVLSGSVTGDLIYGMSGSDSLRGSLGDDSIFGGSGNDLVYGDKGFGLLSGGDDHDRVQGHLESDIIHGGTGADTLIGLDGDDIIFFDQDDVLFNGGSGSDIAVASSGSTAFTVNLNNKGLETIIGSADGDTFVGALSGDIRIAGGAGLDHYQITLSSSDIAVIWDADSRINLKFNATASFDIATVLFVSISGLSDSNFHLLDVSSLVASFETENPYAGDVDAVVVNASQTTREYIGNNNLGTKSSTVLVNAYDVGNMSTPLGKQYDYVQIETDLLALA